MEYWAGILIGFCIGGIVGLSAGIIIAVAVVMTGRREKNGKDD